MRPRSLIALLLCALGVLAVDAAAFADSSRAGALAVDDRPEREVVSPLLSEEPPVNAIATDAGRLVHYRAGRREVRLVERFVERDVKLVISLGKTRWTYEGEREEGSGRLRLVEYRNSVSGTRYLAEELADESEAARITWFLGHERQFRRLADRLIDRLDRGWRVSGADLVALAGRLRGRLDADEHVEVVPGEAYRIEVRGEEHEGRHDAISLVYDNVRDSFRVRIEVLPIGLGLEERPSHVEVFELEGAGIELPSRLMASYRLRGWKDESIGARYDTKRGAGHQVFEDREEVARLIVGYFPSFL